MSTSTFTTGREAIETDPAKLQRLIADAKQCLAGFAIDMSQYEDVPTLEWADSGCVCDIVFVHKTTGQMLQISNSWINDADGEILQYGFNGGRLAL